MQNLLRRVATVLAVVLALALVPVAVRAQAAATGESNTTSTSFPIGSGTKLGKVDFPTAGVWVDPNANGVTITMLIQLFQASPTIAGLPATNGKVDLDYTCFGTTVEQGTMRAKIRDGNAIVSHTMDQDANCNFFQLMPDARGGAKIPMDTNGRVLLSAQPMNPTGACVPGPNTMCLNDGRFEVEMKWNDGGGNNRGVAFPTADDSGLFYFFDPGNTEMLIKLLDGCESPFSSFWVFAAATTNVEYTLTVTDTQTGTVQQYFNPLGQAAPAITDTLAFATCP